MDVVALDAFPKSGRRGEIVAAPLVAAPPVLSPSVRSCRSDGRRGAAGLQPSSCGQVVGLPGAIRHQPPVGYAGAGLAGSLAVRGERRRSRSDAWPNSVALRLAFDWRKCWQRSEPLCQRSAASFVVVFRSPNNSLDGTRGGSGLRLRERE